MIVGADMKRREFIAGLGSAAVWPFAAGAQQGAPVPRLGVLSLLDQVGRRIN
jgi:hypothetical protein